MSDGQSGETREDGALLRAVAARDRAFQELYARYHVMLFSLALKILCDRAEDRGCVAGDLRQVWKTAVSFDEQRGKPLGWFIMLTRKRAIGRIRSRKTRANMASRLGKACGRRDAGGRRAGDGIPAHGAGCTQQDAGRPADAD